MIEMSDQMRKELDAVLTPEQLAAIKRSEVDDMVWVSLSTPRTLKELGTTAQQQKELRRLNEERFTLVTTYYSPWLHRDVGEEALKNPHARAAGKIPAGSGPLR